MQRWILTRGWVALLSCRPREIPRPQIDSTRRRTNHPAIAVTIVLAFVKILLLKFFFFLTFYMKDEESEKEISCTGTNEYCVYCTYLYLWTTTATHLFADFQIQTQPGSLAFIHSYVSLKLCNKWPAPFPSRDVSNFSLVVSSFYQAAELGWNWY